MDKTIWQAELKMPNYVWYKDQRVRHIGQSFLTGVPTDELGTVAEVATGRGRSIFSDPGRQMVFVEWDTVPAKAVFRREIEPCDK
jgi:hypothetical protein